MEDRLFELILAIIPVLGIIVTRYIIPLIKANIDTEKLSQYEEWAVLAVRAAEMLFSGQGLGEQKKTYVIEFLTKQFNEKKVVITEQQLEILIESAVKQLNLDKALVEEPK